MTEPERRPPAHSGRSVLLLTMVSALSALSPLIALPFVARAAGPHGFVDIATGQAIGTLAATAIFFGWHIRGPVDAARTTAPERLLWTSLVSRALVATVVLPLAALVALAASMGSPALAAVSAVAFAVQGFGVAWYATGVGRPWIAAAFDTLPRIAANILGGIGALLIGEPLVYPATILVIYVLAVASFTAWTWARTPTFTRGGWQRGLASLRGDWRPAATGTLLTFYETSPMMSLGLASSPAAPLFAPFDRLLKYGYIGVYMITGSFQGWVSSAEGDRGLARMRRATLLHVGLAVVLGAGFAIAAPWAVPLVFGPDFTLAPSTALPGGIALGAMTITAALGLCVLMPSRAHAAYLRAVATGAVLIVPAVLLGAWAQGVTGAATAVAAVQVVVLAISAIAAAGPLRGTGRERTPDVR